MIPSQGSRRTKLIWSFEASSITTGIVDKIVGQEFDALRLVYDPDLVSQSLTFLAELGQEAAKKDRTIL